MSLMVGYPAICKTPNNVHSRTCLQTDVLPWRKLDMLRQLFQHNCHIRQPYLQLRADAPGDRAVDVRNRHLIIRRISLA